MARTKVFCIGFQKTGTTSLEAALRILRYRVCGVIGRDLSIAELDSKGRDLAIATAAKYDAVQDMPWPLFFRELDAAYPGSKFVLTLRDPESWYRSIADHFLPPGTEMEGWTYGADARTPHGNKQRYIEVYTRHNEAVLDYFKDRPGDLLQMDFTKGDGWETLCPFLGRAIPSRPFPRKNTAAQRRTFVSRVQGKLANLLAPRT
jgi:Sulfotransferase domain